MGEQPEVVAEGDMFALRLAGLTTGAVPSWHAAYTALV